MPLDIDSQDIQQIAQSFAQEFRDAGVFDPTRQGDGAQTPEARESVKVQKEQNKTDKETLTKTQKLVKGFTELGGASNTLKFAFNRAKNNLGAVFSTTALARGIGMGITDFQAQLQQGAIGTGGVLDQMGRAWMLAVDPKVLSDLSNQNRQAVIAMGGIRKWHDALYESQNVLYKYTGSLQGALEVTSHAFQTMRLAGIEPMTEMLVNTSTGALQGFGKTMRDISVVTNKTMTEVNESILGMVQTDEMRWRMAGRITEQGRRSELEELANRQKMLLMLGYSTEQAERAGQALNQLAGKDPKERIKDAYKAAAAMSQVGMGAQGQRFAQLEIKGARRNDQDNEEYAKIAAEYMSKAAQSQYATIGQEMATMNMFAKANMGQYKDFTNVASDSYKANVQDMLVGEKAVETMGEMHDTITDGVRWTEQIKNWVMDNPLSSIGTGIAGLLLQTPILLGILRNTAVSAGGMLGGKVGKVAGALWTFAKRLGFIGMMVSGGIGALDRLWESLDQGRSIIDTALWSIGGFFEGVGNGIIDFLDMFTGGFASWLKKWAGKALGKIFDYMGGVDDSTATMTTTPEMVQSYKVAREVGKQSKTFDTPGMNDAQQKFNQALMDVAAKGTTVTPEAAALSDIAKLLEQANINAESAERLTKEQMEMLATIAADGEITSRELMKLRMDSSFQRTRAGG